MSLVAQLRLRIALVLATALVIGTLLTVIIYSRPAHLAITAPPRPVSTAVPLPSSPPSANAAAIRPAAPPVLASHELLFVGASYTQGLGATDYEHAYPYLCGAELGWRIRVAGVAGTGFVNPGPHGAGSFADRIATLPLLPHPNLIIIQGGRNDAGYPHSTFRAAVIHTIDVTRSRFGSMPLVFLGPIPATLPVPASVLAVAATLRSVAAASGVDFVDPIAQHWITEQNARGYGGPVPGHPGNRGYAFIASQLADQLRPIVAKKAA